MAGAILPYREKGEVENAMKETVAGLLVAFSALAVAQSPRLERVAEANVDPPRGYVGTPYERRVCLNAAASFVLTFRLHSENAFGGAGVWIVDSQTYGSRVASVYASRRGGFTVEAVDAFYIAEPQCFLVSAIGGPARLYRLRPTQEEP